MDLDHRLIALAAALALDAAFGEPHAIWSRIPHPAVLMGRAVAALDTRLNRGAARKRAGVVATAALCTGAIALGWAIENLPFGPIFSVLAAASLIAQKSLAEHVLAVAAGLRTGLKEGRAAVARIVGRDPQSLAPSGVARAAMESCAENFSDGVIAPAFWYTLGGLPGIILYKAINTADSMIGHKSEKYREFGWAAARLDDALNWVPARLSGALICAAAGSVAALKIMRRDAGLHRSPNAGWPEAAMAGALGAAMFGPRSYGGARAEDPFINPAGRKTLGAVDVEAAAALSWRAWAIAVAAAALGAMVL